MSNCKKRTNAGTMVKKGPTSWLRAMCDSETFNSLGNSRPDLAIKFCNHLDAPLNMESHTSNVAITALSAEVLPSGLSHRQITLKTFLTFLKLRHDRALSPEEQAIAATQNPLAAIGGEFSVFANAIANVRCHPVGPMIGTYLPLVHRADSKKLAGERKLFLELFLICPLRAEWSANLGGGSSMICSNIFFFFYKNNNNSNNSNSNNSNNKSREPEDGFKQNQEGRG